jgi:hypothetical protein
MTIFQQVRNHESKKEIMNAFCAGRVIEQWPVTDAARLPRQTFKDYTKHDERMYAYMHCVAGEGMV